MAGLLRTLVGCEAGGTVRRAFSARIRDFQPAAQMLFATRRLTPPAKGTAEHKRWAAIHRASPGPDRWKLRSKTFQGVADAMADQWGQKALDSVGVAA